MSDPSAVVVSSIRSSSAIISMLHFSAGLTAGNRNERSEAVPGMRGDSADVVLRVVTVTHDHSCASIICEDSVRTEKTVNLKLTLIVTK